jgi:DNA helicase-2/ATP-dependent DNA helicase PcrA
MTHAQTRLIFGQTRYGRPSRFLGDLPKGVAEHKTTSSMVSSFRPRAGEAGDVPWRERFIDRPKVGWGVQTGPWSHPQAPPRALASEPGQQFVDHEFFDDTPEEAPSEVPIRRGSRVWHKQFGEGQVRAVENVGEPRVLAYFPGWGEKKILARFLKLA